MGLGEGDNETGATPVGVGALKEVSDEGFNGVVGATALGVRGPGLRPGLRGLLFRMSLNVWDVADSRRSCGVVDPCTGCAFMS